MVQIPAISARSAIGFVVAVDGSGPDLSHQRLVEARLWKDRNAFPR